MSFFHSLLTTAGSTELFEESYGDLLFDENRVYGFVVNIAGNLVIDPTGADTTKVVLIYHKDYTSPSFTGAVVVETGDYVEGVLNIIRVGYNGVTFDVAYHAQV